MDENPHALVKSIHTRLEDSTLKFHGVKIDTGANRKSIMSTQQYGAFCRVFGLKKAFNYTQNLAVKGIGGKQPGVGTESIKIPFKKLHLIIEVEFLIVSGDIPSQFYLKYMIMDCLDIRIQNETVSLQRRTQRLRLDHFLSYTSGHRNRHRMRYTPITN